ncbi:hypothetical protein Tco_0601131 [Tanacetum coccineum]
MVSATHSIPKPYLPSADPQNSITPLKFLSLCYEVIKYIHGFSVDATTSTPTPLTPEELKVDSIVLSWIFTTLSDTLQARLVVEHPRSANAAWDLLTEIVKDNKRSLTIALKVELRSIKLGLPHKYNNVCGIIHHREPFPDLKTARSMLTTEEMRLKSTSHSLPVDSSSSSPMVIVTKSCTNRRPSNPQVKSWRPCYNFAKGVSYQFERPVPSRSNYGGVLAHTGLCRDGGIRYPMEIETGLGKLWYSGVETGMASKPQTGPITIFTVRSSSIFTLVYVAVQKRKKALARASVQLVWQFQAEPKSTWDDLILYHESLSDVKESRVMDLKSELTSLFGKLKYEENLIDSIYETEKKKSLATATPLSTAFISTSIVQDFQDSPDDENDIRSSQEYMDDLEEEFHERALLAKSKRFFKKGTKRFSGAKATDQT